MATSESKMNETEPTKMNVQEAEDIEKDKEDMRQAIDEVKDMKKKFGVPDTGLEERFYGVKITSYF